MVLACTFICNYILKPTEKIPYHDHEGPVPELAKPCIRGKCSRNCPSRLVAMWAMTVIQLHDETL